MAMFIGLISVVGITFLIIAITGSVRKSERTNKNYMIAAVCFVLLIGVVPFSGDSTEAKEAETTITEAETKDEGSCEPQLTISQQDAITQAEKHISTTPFSRSGLIKQLEFEGYSTEDATFAVNNITVNWKEQAVKHAKSHNNEIPMSRKSLMKHLIESGHSVEESEYAVSQLRFL